MKLPRLTLTQSARAQLQKLMASIHDFTPVASVQWSADGSFTRPDGSGGPLPDGWDVGFYDARKVPPEFLQDIDGIAFVLEGIKSDELDGRTLDFDGKRFRIGDTAI